MVEVKNEKTPEEAVKNHAPKEEEAAPETTEAAQDTETASEAAEEIPAEDTEETGPGDTETGTDGDPVKEKKKGLKKKPKEDRRVERPADEKSG